MFTAFAAATASAFSLAAFSSGLLYKNAHEMTLFARFSGTHITGCVAFGFDALYFVK